MDSEDDWQPRGPIRSGAGLWGLGWDIRQGATLLTGGDLTNVERAVVALHRDYVADLWRATYDSDRICPPPVAGAQRFADACARQPDVVVAAILLFCASARHAHPVAMDYTEFIAWLTRSGWRAVFGAQPPRGPAQRWWAALIRQAGPAPVGTARGERATRGSRDRAQPDTWPQPEGATAAALWLDHARPVWQRQIAQALGRRMGSAGQRDQALSAAQWFDRVHMTLWCCARDGVPPTVAWCSYLLELATALDRWHAAGRTAEVADAAVYELGFVFEALSLGAPVCPPPNRNPYGERDKQPWQAARAKRLERGRRRLLAEWSDAGAGRVALGALQAPAKRADALLANIATALMVSLGKGKSMNKLPIGLPGAAPARGLGGPITAPTPGQRDQAIQ